MPADDGGDDQAEGDDGVDEPPLQPGDHHDGDGADQGDHEQLPAESGRRRERSAHLAEGKPCEGHTTEREVIAHVLGQDERRGHRPQPPPRHSHRRAGQDDDLDQDGDQVPGDAELAHPEPADGVQREPGGCARQ